MPISSCNDDDSSSSASSPPITPSTRRFPTTPHRPDVIGVDPSQLVGKILKGVRRSRTHPNVTLHFTDNTAFQILVDGYDPRHRGIPKSIETDPALEPIFNHPGDVQEVHLTVANAARVTLADKAFDLGGRGSQWNQAHAGIALKFKEDNRWHCVWATLAEYEGLGKMNCVFRSYNDVYLNALHQSPASRKSRTRRQGRGGRNAK